MAGLARHVSAALVLIAMIVAQVLPAWADCHGRTHTARAIAATMVTDATTAAPVHHGMNHRSTSPDVQATNDIIATADDPVTSSPNHRCLGNCGCACGISAAVVLTSVFAVDAPTGITINRDLVSTETTRGRMPDGPRRPPRIIA